MVFGFATTYMQSVSITTNVVSSNPVHGEVYSIQYYVIKFVSDWRQVGGFSPGIPVSFTNKTKLHDVIEIYLKNVKHHNPNPFSFVHCVVCPLIYDLLWRWVKKIFHPYK
jgi:hypothetical protein